MQDAAPLHEVRKRTGISNKGAQSNGLSALVSVREVKASCEQEVIFIQHHQQFTDEQVRMTASRM
ncbi:hypothetical protein WH50_01965 [Pokkaliibacter plantistimulans]|uniref:Uncharacterized protein n=1 Tax=Pokkaliibacter plantistimulans TaxID=1635171 RepID=A0ABX5M5C7_9GAMM|nr:hypothetical protein WH50_01965 [Pokkaliibacter plantistimulans]